MGDPAAPPGPVIFQGMGVGELRTLLAQTPGDTVLYIDIGEYPDPPMSFAIFARDILQLRDPAPPEREETVKVKNDGLRVRSTPEIRNDNIVAMLKAGTVLVVKGSILKEGYVFTQIIAGPYAGQYVARSDGSQTFLVAG